LEREMARWPAPNDKYMQLTPATKNLINGSIFVARVAAKAAMM